MVFEHSHDFGASGLSTWDCDSFGCLGCRINHSLEFGIIKRMNRLFKYIRLKDNYLGILLTYLICSNEPLDCRFLEEFIRVRNDSF